MATQNTAPNIYTPNSLIINLSHSVLTNNAYADVYTIITLKCRNVAYANMPEIGMVINLNIDYYY